eukprot:Transcript_27585.p1 GENE.Transcript_27585~~Transcript_27585.p1  ORF type:complete len:443 (+),score=34.80 Transcript_27585:100-1428(+)
MPKQTGTQLSKRVCCGWLLCTPGLVEATAIEAVAALQRTIESRFLKLRAEGLRALNATELLQTETLGVPERCYLCEKGVLGQHGGCDAYTPSRCIRARESKAAHLGKVIHTCWAHAEPNTAAAATLTSSALHFALCDRHPALKLGSTLLSRYQSLQKHEFTLEGLKLRVLFVGDSIMGFTRMGAQCHVLLNSGNSRAQLPLLERFSTNSKHRLNHTGSPETRINLRELGRAVAALSKAGGGIVVMSLGVHYNNHYKMSGLTYSHHSRTEFEQDVLAALEILDQFAKQKGCSRCFSVWLTAPTQHFATPDGTFPASLSGDAPGCRPLPHSLDASSANRWRAEVPMQAARSLNKSGVLVVPFHLLTDGLWDAHPQFDPEQCGGSFNACAEHYGMSRNTRVAENSSGSCTYGHACTVNDCTHYCFSPFEYEPVWYALSQVVKIVQ